MRKKSLFLMLFLIALILINANVMAQSGVTAVIVNDWSNVRIVPEIGAELITTVPAGYYLEFITGRSGDNQWLRINFNGNELLEHGTTEGMENAFLLVTTFFIDWWWIDAIYVIGSVALGFHLYHAIWSAFQTLGWSNGFC